MCTASVLVLLCVACGSQDEPAAHAPTKNTNPAATSGKVEKTTVEKGFESKVEKLIESTGDINRANERDIPLLYWAVNHQYVDAARTLLESGANPDVAAKRGSSTPVLFATAIRLSFGDDPKAKQRIRKSRIIAELLIRHGANVMHKTKLGRTPLHQAARNGRADLCELLIENGAEANAADKLGNTPLHLAAKTGHWEAANVLLKHGAQADEANRLGATALSLARQRDEESLALKIRKEDRRDYRPDMDFDRTIRLLSKQSAKP